MLSSAGDSAGQRKLNSACSAAEACAARQMKTKYGSITAVRPISRRLLGVVAIEPGQRCAAPSPASTPSASTTDSATNSPLKQLPGAARIALVFGAEHRQEAGRQRPLAKDPPRKVRYAEGDHEGVHHAPLAQPQ